LYRKMLELRAVDERLRHLKLKDLVMNGFHPYEGQEAVAVGVLTPAQAGDYVVSTHRPQGHALAKGASMRSVFCEMLGRIGGPSNGLGGPMQWIDTATNFFCGSIVGSGICDATGFALACQREGRGRICISFFGDGASNTGSFHEGLNLAALWRLPVLFVCENNQYGEAMPARDFIPVEHISVRAAGYGIDGSTVDGMDVLVMADAAEQAIAAIRGGCGPILIEAETYRYRGHYMGDPENYRTKEEVEQWRKRDPIDQCRSILIKQYGVSDETLQTVEQDVRKEAQEAEAWALEQPKPTLEYAVSNVLVSVGGRVA